MGWTLPYNGAGSCPSPCFSKALGYVQLLPVQGYVWKSLAVTLLPQDGGHKVHVEKGGKYEKLLFPLLSCNYKTDAKNLLLKEKQEPEITA